MNPEELSRSKKLHVRFNVHLVNSMTLQLLESPDFISNYMDKTLEMKRDVKSNVEDISTKVLEKEFEYLTEGKGLDSREEIAKYFREHMAEMREFRRKKILEGIQNN